MSPAQRVYRFGAITCAVLALVSGYYAATLRWVPQTDFDIIGFLWVAQNLPRLFACFLTFILTGVAIHLAVRAVRG